MTEVKRYRADRVPVKWNKDWHIGEVQEVYLASDYDALLAKARRLREVAEDCLPVEGETFDWVEMVNRLTALRHVVEDTTDLVEHDMSGPDGPVADSSDGYKILQCEHEEDSHDKS